MPPKVKSLKPRPGTTSVNPGRENVNGSEASAPNDAAPQAGLKRKASQTLDDDAKPTGKCKEDRAAKRPARTSSPQAPRGPLISASANARNRSETDFSTLPDDVKFDSISTRINKLSQQLTSCQAAIASFKTVVRTTSIHGDDSKLEDIAAVAENTEAEVSSLNEKVDGLATFGQAKHLDDQLFKLDAGLDHQLVCLSNFIERRFDELEAKIDARHPGSAVTIYHR